MAVKSLQVIYGGSEVVDNRIFPYLAPGEIIDTSHLCFLVRADEGNILVDCGGHPEDVETRMAKGARLNVKSEDHLPHRLKEVGLSMDDINMVILTHSSWDHCGYVNDLLGAEVVFQWEEYRFCFDTPPYAFQKVAMTKKRIDSPQVKWKLVHGDQILMPGITLLFTPGHTPGHQSVLVELPNYGPVIITGDCADLQEDFKKERLPNNDDPRQAFYSIRKLNVLSKVLKAPLLTTHDLDFYRREMRKVPEMYN
ncbi:N-acyl homoserine lactonase family protein [Chloroflexota bacterium]